MRGICRVLAAVLAAMAFAHGTPARAETVDLLLVLAADVSRSIDEQEFELQRKGYAAALTHPRVLQAIRSGERGKIAISVVEWSGESYQHTLIDWTVVQDEESAGVIADALLRAPRPFANRTSIGEAVDYSVALLKRSPHQGTRRVIDVSGDGTNTNGLDPNVARDAAVGQGITINGLVILSAEPMPWNPWHTHPPGGLENYYRNNVVGGPGAFTMVAEDFNSFAFALINKLVREIADSGGRPDGYTVSNR